MTMYSEYRERLKAEAEDLQRFAAEVENERLALRQEEAERYFVEAADSLYCVIIGEINAAEGIDDALALLGQVPAGTHFDPLVTGLMKLQLNAINNLRFVETSLLVFLGAMAACDPTTNESEEGQIVAQFGEAIAYMRQGND